MIKSPESLGPPQKPTPEAKKPEAPERTPEEEAVLIKFEALLLQAEKINEGAEGIIAKVDLSKADKELREFMLGEAELPEEHVIKLLKVYRPGNAKAEYEAQSAAYEALSGLEGAAQVPKPYLYKDVPIKTPELKERLETRFGGAGGDSVEIMVMDLIDGDDLATAMYREVIRRDTRKFVHVKDRVDEMDFDELQRRVQQGLGFDRPGGKARSAEERAFEEQRVFQANAELLYDDLKKKDFALDPEVRQKIKKALEVLHEKSVFHRDLHLRNVMLGKSGEVYLIDFGKASVGGGADRSEIYQLDEGRSFIEDETILEVCRRLEGQSWMAIPENLKSEISENAVDEGLAYQIDHLMELLEERGVELNAKILKNFISNTVGPISEADRADNEAVLLLSLASRSEGYAQIVKDYIEQRKEEAETGGKLQSLLEKIGREL